MYWDSTMLLLIPAIIFTLYAQFKVQSTFKRYNKQPGSKGYTGADVARILLEKEGVFDVAVEHVPGNLTDHYDPRTKVLRLSDSVYSSRSIAALGVAAHETGHAIQHHRNYVPLTIRGNLLPGVMLGSNLAMPLIIIGFILASLGNFGMIFVYAGIALFAVVVLFQLVTLPVEFNASSRAIAMLDGYSLLGPDEVPHAKKVLNAAALTYLAAAAVALLNLLRFILMASNRRD